MDDVLATAADFLQSGQSAAARAVLFARALEPNPPLEVLVRLRELQLGERLPAPPESWPTEFDLTLQEPPPSAQPGGLDSLSRLTLPFLRGEKRRRHLETLIQRRPRWRFLYRQLASIEHAPSALVGAAALALVEGSVAAWVDLGEKLLAADHPEGAIAVARRAQELDGNATAARDLLRRASLRVAAAQD